ncbi:MAG: ABC transporter substrate-binding protein [Actinomycetota bacterium]|nr:ABC transporter substrate-binding protein [Actinomycetota bacterium]
MRTDQVVRRIGRIFSDRFARPAVAVAGSLLLATVLAACSSTSTSSTSSSSSSSSTAPAPPSTAPGVTATTIRVGVISSLTGAIAADFDGFSPGMQAYFDMIDARGGVDGRKLVLAYNLDDGSNPSQFTQLSHSLLEQDHVFAAGVSSFFFTPALFVATHTPTYGYNVSGNWQGPNNLFAAGGSVESFNAGVAPVAYLAHRTHATSVAVISYGPAITSSYDACKADAVDLAASGVHVAYDALDAQLGGNYTPAVQQMQQKHVDFVISCLQSSDNITLSRDLRQYGVNATQLWLDGYDQALLDHYTSLMQGVYIDLNGTVPFDVVHALPGGYPGMATYLAAMKRYEPKFEFSSVALQGWQSAALLAEGIKRAGKNLTQANLIAVTNQITNFTAGGLTIVVNWARAHTTQTYPACSDFVKVKGKTFLPVTITGHQVFACFDKSPNLKDPKLATPPAGTPGT